MKGTCAALAGPSLLAGKPLTAFALGPLAPNGCLHHGMQESGRTVLAHQTLGSLALAAVALYKTFSTPSCCSGRHFSARGAGCLAKHFERLKS
ncbi:MAG: hypothetical protein WBE80_14155 [Methylocella sp.]